MSNHVALNHSSDFYLEQFFRQELKRVSYPKRPYGYYRLHADTYVKMPSASSDAIMLFEDEEMVYCIIEDEATSFELYIKSQYEQVKQTDVQLAQHVLANITELDQRARKSEEGNERFDYKEMLFCVYISEEVDREICFRYAATTVNTEWWVYFTKQDDGTLKYHGMNSPSSQQGF